MGENGRAKLIEALAARELARRRARTEDLEIVVSAHSLLDEFLGVTRVRDARRAGG